MRLTADGQIAKDYQGAAVAAVWMGQALFQQPVNTPDGPWQMARRSVWTTGRGDALAGVTGGCNVLAACAGGWMRRLDGPQPVLTGSRDWQPSSGRVGDGALLADTAVVLDDEMIVGTVYYGGIPAGTFQRSNPFGALRLSPDGTLAIWVEFPGPSVVLLDLTTGEVVPVQTVGGACYTPIAFVFQGRPWIGYQTDAMGLVFHPADDASYGYQCGMPQSVYDPDVIPWHGGVVLGWSRDPGQFDTQTLTIPVLGQGMVPLVTPEPPEPPEPPVPPIPPIPPIPPEPPTMRDRLVSEDGRFTLIQQNDGNLVTYGPNGFTVGYGKVYVPPSPPIPPLPPGPWPTGTEVTDVRDNFCNLKDGDLTIFTPYLGSMNEADFQRWMSILRANGSTHVTIAPDCTYPGYPLPAVKLLRDPAGFRAFVLKVLNTPSASGKGFCPIIMLDEGGPDPRSRIDQYWRPLLDDIKDLLPHCIVTPGWELIKASDWTSADLSYALKWLGAYGIPNLWLHLSQGRASGSSNPIEPDDPWQGAEKDFWYTHGGEFLTGLLYQSYTVRDGETINCDVNDDNCWLNRWADVVPRCGAGMNGWRIVHLCLFEGPAYYAIRNQCSPETAREWARAGRALADEYGVVVSHGNGLP